jgi:two-component system, OmpR family, phosphate regulon response regulator PhoB
VAIGIDTANQRTSILIIEDHADTREGYATYLRWAGYSVTDAASGEDGLALAARLLPDIIVLDVTLGGMNGLEVLAELRTSAATRDIPVVLVTGSDIARHVLKDASADCVLQKPLAPAVLLGHLERVIRDRA